jgi:adenosine deaminase
LTQDQIKDFVERLPKCELHLHFEGAVPMGLVRRWCIDPIPDRPKWREHDYRYRSFADFGQVIDLTWRETCNSLERLEGVSTRIYEQLFGQNVRYLEMSFGVGAYPYPPDETLAAFKSGVPDGMTVKIIGALSRDRDVGAVRLARATEYIDADALDGVDIHGNETVGDPKVFLDLYERARFRGLILKAHAGELCGPESVEQMLDTMKVNRIQHGVRGVESERLMKRFVDEGICLDLCPWSNVKLGVYPDLETHPVADLHRAGVRVTVNTDDPTPFGQTLTDEYGWLMSRREMTSKEVGQIAKNGFVVADLPDMVMNQAILEIDDVVTAFSEETT